MTKNEKTEKIAKLELECASKRRSVRSDILWTGFYLIVMIGVNGLASYLSRGIDPVALFLSAMPAVSLFVTSGRLEQNGLKGWVGAVFLLSAVVSGITSWYHTWEVLLHYGQPAVIAALFPIVLDVPMILLAKSILDGKARIAQIGHEVQMLTSLPQRATSTVRANRTSAAKAATKTSGAKAPKTELSPVTA